mgnify:FL=1
MKSKKIISGLDVLKFFMAFLIVDIHVHGSILCPPILLTNVVYPIESLAVPTFFVISSFLFFRKARYEEKQHGLVLHFLKRLCILYLFWCAIWSPIIYIQKDYFHPMSVWIPLYIVRDFLFGSMFDASWFLGALLVGVPLVTLLMKSANEWLGMIVCFTVYLFVTSNHIFPEQWMVINEWYKQNVCHGGMWLSFPSGLLWIAIGYLMANKDVITSMEKIRNYWAWTAALLCFILSFFVPVVPKILCVVALFVAAYTASAVIS